MKRIALDDGWKFHLEDENETPFAMLSLKNQEAEGYAARFFNAAYWDDVSLPHDWGMKIPKCEKADRSHGHRPISPVHWNGGFEKHERVCSVGWYRKTFFVPKEALGKRILVEFDGIFRDSRVYVNGQYIDRFDSGYIGFRCDLTDNLYYGEENVLAVCVDAREIEGWWYEGAGIYRHARLLVSQPLHLDAMNLRVTADADGRFTLAGEAVNEGSEECACAVRYALSDENGVVLSDEAFIKAGKWDNEPFFFEGSLDHARLWSPDEPNLYKLEIEIGDKNGHVDREEMNVGFRTFRFDADQGLFVNEIPVKIQGACIHQDFAGVGVALPDELHEYKIRRLKEMGVNAYRTSHNAPAPEIVDACDRLGMLIMDETRMFGSTPSAMNAMETLVKRDRNHASVLMWSMGNEEHSVQNTEVGARIARTVMRRIRALDPTRVITYGGNNGGNYEGVNAEADVRGVNYVHIHKQSFADEYHAQHPNQPMFGSEEASVVTTRGEYRGTPNYPTAYGEGSMPWASTAEGWWKFYAKRPYLCGGFMWTGFDYFGEPTPYVRNTVTTFGAIDVCGFAKDAYYYYQSCWKKEPVLHLFPHWNWNDGEEVRVVVYTNADEAELFLNGASLGRKRAERYGHLEWKVPFRKGTLEAVGYANGREVLRDRRVTAGNAARVKLFAEPAAEGGNIYLVRAEIQDENGNPVPDAANEVYFACEGARFLGVGNGDPSSYEEDQFGDELEKREIIDWTRTEDGEEIPWDAFALRSNEHYIYHNIAQKLTRVENVPPFEDEYRMVYADAAPKREARFDAVFTAKESEYSQILFERLEGKHVVTLNGEEIGRGDAKGCPCAFDVKLQNGLNRLSVEVSDVHDAGGVYLGVWLARKKPLPWKRRAFHGLALAIVKAEGNAKISAFSDGLNGSEIEITQP